VNLGRYQLLAQLGAGRDGSAFRARVAADSPLLEVRDLSPARADADRWRVLVRRLQLAALLDHPGALTIRELDLDGSPPLVALEWMEDSTLSAVLAERVPLPAPRAATLAGQLATALAESHRLGLVHGRLCPGTIRCNSSLVVKIDFTGADTRPPLRKGNVVLLDASCRSPSWTDGGLADPAEDVYALGAILFWLLTGQRIISAGAVTLPANLPGALASFLGSALAPDPLNRPTARAWAEFLAPRESLEATAIHQVPGTQAANLLSTRRTLGRYRLREKLGQGGMGEVYRAEDVADGRVVAIKVLRPEWARQPDALRRFHKEARLLAEISNPHVTSLLEINEEAGLHYLVLEFVAGPSLNRLLGEHGRLDERSAVAIAADVVRGLTEAHERGIVHRDIKPENILLSAKSEILNPKSQGNSNPAIPKSQTGQAAVSDLGDSDFAIPWDLGPGISGFIAKLSDFGLGRHVVESESLNLTQAGSVLGTPLYMSPEQGTGGNSDARSDVYSLGATLFRILAGRPPFLAETPWGLIVKHRDEPPPPLHQLNPTLSEGVVRVVEKCLAKAPEARYANAAELLRDLERLLRGEPTGITVHPALPVGDPNKVIAFNWSWELEASPQRLWPLVANTERLNRAAGLPAVQFTAELDPDGGTRRFGRFRKMGVTAAWREHPFEWVEGVRMGVLREYSQGPFRWLMSLVELAPRPGGGTTLSHRVRLEPLGLLGRTVAAVEVGLKGRRAVDHIYRRIDAALSGKLGSSLADPFEEPPHLSAARRQRLAQLLDRLSGQGVDAVVLERLGDFLTLASPQEVTRIRPLALAHRLGLDPEQVVAACLHGAREGLFLLLWDLLCPVCRIPATVEETLRALREHGHCEACNLDFELDFTRSVEMIFRAHPEVRETELGVYCIGGPAHSPHVAAQVRLAPGERLELELALGEGSYRLRGPQLPFNFDFRVQGGPGAGRLELPLARGPGPDTPTTLKPGRQVLVLTNAHGRELVVRIERTVPRADALTAARASALALFRELFPGEVLSPGQLASVATLTFLATDLEGAAELYADLGDARAFALLHEHFRLLEQRIRRENGSLVKTVSEGVLAVFVEAAAAVRAGLEILADGNLRISRGDGKAALPLRVGIHRGPVLAATLNDRLDYFGSTVNLALQLPRLAAGGELVLTQAVASDPQVSALCRERGLEGSFAQPAGSGWDAGPVQRFRLPASNAELV
jgi:serine/threonine protein kinase/class 3 adenylate cyclase